MGLLKFLKNAGQKVLGKGDNNREIEKLVETELGDQFRNLNIVYENGVVDIRGETDSQDVKEKAVLIAGNVSGVDQVKDDNFNSPKEMESEFYTIVSGDTLSKIAKRYYGDAMKYPAIFEANREVIKDPNLIYPGQQIRIPKVT